MGNYKNIRISVKIKIVKWLKVLVFIIYIKVVVLGTGQESGRFLHDVAVPHRSYLK